MQIAKTPIRKDKPIFTAKANPLIANSMPPFLAPVPYEPPQPKPKAEPAPQPEPKFSPRQVTLPAGMTVQIRLNESLSSDRGAPGDTFDASLAEPLIIDGLVIAERGARAGGRIIAEQKAGVALELTNLVTADGQKIAISTDPGLTRDASGACLNKDAAKIGGGVAAGRDYRRCCGRCKRRGNRRRGWWSRRCGNGPGHARKTGEHSFGDDHPVPAGDASDD